MPGGINREEKAVKKISRNLVLAAACFWAAAASADNAAVDPASHADGGIVITGAVENRLALTEADLAGLPQDQIKEVKVVCDDGPDKGVMKSLTGVRLRYLLERATVKAENHMDRLQTVIIVKARDDYRTVYSWSEIFNSQAGDAVYAYFRKNGKPLGDEEGPIATISTGDLHSCARLVKWVSEIEVRKEAR